MSVLRTLFLNVTLEEEGAAIVALFDLSFLDTFTSTSLSSSLEYLVKDLKINVYKHFIFEITSSLPSAVTVDFGFIFH